MAGKKRVLIVEDSRINRDILKELLSEKYEVLEAENGLKALRFLQENKSDISLILLDVVMPEMDGLTFLDKIKEDAELALIPVIVMTASDREADEIAALEHGATDFVLKPFHPQIILHRIDSLISLRENAAMANQYRYDHLTGLYSKEFFYEKAREQILAHPEQKHTILCSNVENFKLFNDIFGISAGDHLLKEIADMYRDLMEGDDICGRFNADRFLLLHSGSEREDYIRLLEMKPKTVGRIEGVVLKFGIYEVSDLSVSLEKMCDRALLAANSIKGQYNEHFAVYDDALRTKLLREQRITDCMETALSEGQFTVYLQPKLSLSDDRLAGAEALVRWIHPEMGFLSPGEFIPLFEKNGFITQLDKFIWEQVCILLRDWRERGMAEVPVSVNVSRADIYQADLADILTQLVRKYEVDPRLLHLEITESAYTENPEQIIDAVSRLRGLGFIIEMDDFGSGYSSLNMLNEMKLDVLKLDMRFIQSETTKPLSQGVLRFIMELARGMNLSVTVEGVETGEQLERIRELGCDYVQGYFFAKPMPAVEFEEYLKEKPSETAQENKSMRYAAILQTLLVVDEDAAYRKLVCEAFRERYRVLEATNAEAALACMKEHAKDEAFLVILSMTLPEKEAETILRAMRKEAELWRVPVLATMPQRMDLEKRALELYVDDFIKKPHTKAGLRKRIAQMMAVSAQQTREKVLQDEACHDYLTHLLNRRGLHVAIDALRQEDLPLALCIFDLDDLREVNDDYGHDKGDELLISFGELLRKKTRSGDILCRYGGDEFVVILRNIGQREVVQRKGAEICKDIGALCRESGFHTSCSAGVVICVPEEKPTAALLEQADQALHQAKQKGKGICCLWNEQENCGTA